MSIDDIKVQRIEDFLVKQDFEAQEFDYKCCAVKLLKTLKEVEKAAAIFAALKESLDNHRENPRIAWEISKDESIEEFRLDNKGISSEVHKILTLLLEQEH